MMYHPYAGDIFQSLCAHRLLVFLPHRRHHCAVVPVASPAFTLFTSLSSTLFSIVTYRGHIIALQTRVHTSSAFDAYIFFPESNVYYCLNNSETSRMYASSRPTDAADLSLEFFVIRVSRRSESAALLASHAH